jgi:hypothetical protein
MALDYLQINCHWLQRNIQTLTISGFKFCEKRNPCRNVRVFSLLNYYFTDSFIAFIYQEAISVAGTRFVSPHCSAMGQKKKQRKETPLKGSSMFNLVSILYIIF